MEQEDSPGDPTYSPMKKRPFEWDLEYYTLKGEDDSGDEYDHHVWESRLYYESNESPGSEMDFT